MRYWREHDLLTWGRGSRKAYALFDRWIEKDPAFTQWLVVITRDSYKRRHYLRTIVPYLLACNLTLGKHVVRIQRAWRKVSSLRHRAATTI